MNIHAKTVNISPANQGTCMCGLPELHPSIIQLHILNGVIDLLYLDYVSLCQRKLYPCSVHLSGCPPEAESSPVEKLLLNPRF